MDAVDPVGRLLSDDRRLRSEKSAEFFSEIERLRPFEDVARQVLRLRMAHQLSQEALAQRVGTTKSAISRLESGQHAPNLGSLQRIAAAFGGQLVIGFDVPDPTPTRDVAVTA